MPNSRSWCYIGTRRGSSRARDQRLATSHFRKHGLRRRLTHRENVGRLMMNLEGGCPCWIGAFCGIGHLSLRCTRYNARRLTFCESAAHSAPEEARGQYNGSGEGDSCCLCVVSCTFDPADTIYMILLSRCPRHTLVPQCIQVMSVRLNC